MGAFRVQKGLKIITLLGHNLTIGQGVEFIGFFKVFSELFEGFLFKILLSLI